MATPSRFLPSLVRGTLSSLHAPARANPAILPFLCPVQQQSRNLNQAQMKAKKRSAGQKKKFVWYKSYNLNDAERFSLCDAMRYIRAFEAGRPPSSVKYEIHVRFRTKKSTPTIKNHMNLPHPVGSGAKFCVICPPDSKAAEDAKKFGAMLIGEEEVFEVIKSGKIEFNRCICHSASLEKMNKAGLGRILGPRGLMPSAKMGTVVNNVGSTLRNIGSATRYRERDGVVRAAIGQLGYSPEELRKNIRSFVTKLRQDAAELPDEITKEIAEVVLSSTNAPGFSLTGDFKTEDSPPIHALTGP